MFEIDNLEYTALLQAAEQIGKTKIPGAVLEIGTRRGGSLEIIVNTLADNGDTGRLIVSVDPYGGIPFAISDGEPVKNAYTNLVRDLTIPKLFEFIIGKGFNFVFFNIEDTEFFKRFADGIPIYDKEKQIVSQYALTYVDGQHSTNAVTADTNFLVTRVPAGGIVVYDDCPSYDHASVEKILFGAGFSLHCHIAPKKSYIKK